MGIIREFRGIVNYEGESFLSSVFFIFGNVLEVGDLRAGELRAWVKGWYD